MENIEVMQFLETKSDLNESSPNFIFGESWFLLLLDDDLLIEVSIIGEIHDDAVWEGVYQRELA